MAFQCSLSALLPKLHRSRNEGHQTKSMDDISLKEKELCPALNSGSKPIADEELSDLLNSRFRLTKTIISLENRVDQWFAYFHTLSKIESHYTAALERSHIDTMYFTWKDSFKPFKKHSHTTISSEKMVVVFNIGVVYSQIAAGENRGTSEGLTNAFKAFQNAAGTWRYLMENFEGGESFDVSRECVSMLETLMLAQALECFFSRAVMDGKSPKSCSQVARLVGLYYEDVQRALSTAPLDQHLDKEWLLHVQLKASRFYAESCYHYSLHLHEDCSFGEEIARLRMGLDHLRSTKKSVKCAYSSNINVISRLEKDINIRLEKAEKMNKSFYFIKVPAASSLSDLPAYNLERPRPLEHLVALDNANYNEKIEPQLLH